MSLLSEEVTYQLELSLSNCIGCPTSPDILSTTLLLTLKFWPPITFNSEPLSAFCNDAANLKAIEVTFMT